MTEPGHGGVGGGALIVGSDYLSALAIARSLGRRGIPVWALMDDAFLANSRYCRRVLPWPDADEALLVAYLVDLARRFDLRGWAIYPTGDNEAALLARNFRPLSGWFRVCPLPWSVLEVAFDKRLTYQVADRLGIPYPWTAYPNDCADLADLARPFPLILKPAVKTHWNAFTRARAWRVDDPTSLFQRYRAARELVPAGTIMIQELIEGGGESQFSFAGLCVDGRVQASLIACRRRQRPPDFGRVSTYVETIEDPGVAEPATTLLQALGFTGLVEIEFKRDVRDGCLKLLDVNARPWAWLSLGGWAGVDFPYLLWEVLHGRSVPRSSARPGARWLHVALDIPTSVRQIAHRRLRARDYLMSFSQLPECATLTADDPLPAVAELRMLLGRRLKR